MTFVISPFAKFPETLKQKINTQMWNYNNTNLAILETSHRSPVFAKVNDDTILALRKYLNVPDKYKVLLMQGGEQLTQGAIPFNLLKQNKKCTYLVTGPRSLFASEEARKHTDVNVEILSQEGFEHRKVDDSAYTYACIQDRQSGFFINQPTPLPNETTVLDCTSILGLYPINIKNHGIVFGSIQFSLGLPGVCITIVREDLVGQQLKQCPNMLSFATMQQKKSIYNTPNCFAVYTLGQHITHLLSHGGLQSTYHSLQQLISYTKSLIQKSHQRVIATTTNTFSILSLIYKHNILTLSSTLKTKKILLIQNQTIQINIQASTTKQDIDLLFNEINQQQ